MKNWKIWVLTNQYGVELARGRKRDVVRVLHCRYVYGHIYTDCLYRTAEPLVK